ncbi:MAG: hydroxypyruvate isomerase [Burkholderiales bacterium]|nr:hydroxypyruvate isomerase [Burkholderiales bacterium]
MPRFAANLTMLFNEVPFMERFAAARAAGFDAVEYLFPYDFAMEALAAELAKHSLKQVLFNLPAGNWASGERGIASHPDRVGEFQEGVGRAIEYARALQCPQMNCLAGIAPQGVARERAEETLVANLRFAATRLKEAGLRLVIEPINHFDMPGFLLNTTRQGLDIIARTGSDNVFIQYDIYHMQRMEGELANTVKAHLPMIKHIQLADNPGRNEPGTGEINYRFLFAHLDAIGYDGWVGCEYKPRTTTQAGLGWIEAHA